MAIYIIAGVILLLIALYLFCIAPRIKKKNFKLPKVGYAHRGLWNEENPENSLSAFSAAVERGYGIETDVRLTKDKIAVVFHDDTLARMCGDDRRVADCTYAELSELHLANSDQKIPTFEEFLAIAGGKVPLLVELKGEDLQSELCDVVAPMLDPLGDMAVVESFNPLLLRKMRKLRPNVPRGQLVTALVSQRYPGNILRNAALSSLLLNVLSRPDFIAYDKNFPDSVSVNVCVKLFGAKPFIWTVKGASEIAKANEKNICPIFEDPDKE